MFTVVPMPFIPSASVCLKDSPSSTENLGRECQRPSLKSRYLPFWFLQMHKDSLQTCSRALLDIYYKERDDFSYYLYQQYFCAEPAMGQAEPGSASKSEAQAIDPSNRYEPDLHTLEMESLLPSTFSHQIQKIISEVEKVSRNIEEHSLERYLIFSIDQRFSKFNTVDSELFHSSKNSGNYITIVASAFPSEHWEQLRSRESFFKVMVHFHKCYHVQIKLRQEYEKLISSFDKKTELTSEATFETLRKPSLKEINVSRQMDQGLIMRLIFYYYIKIIKLNASSHSSHLSKFHAETGSMLCQLILWQYLQLQQLFELLYELVCIDKLPESQLKSIIAKIHRQYNGMCLKNSYSIKESKERMEVVGTATRIYLDQLYLKSLQEAEDPDIKNTDDTLMPIKVFPISRVKDKQKN